MPHPQQLPERQVRRELREQQPVRQVRRELRERPEQLREPERREQQQRKRHR